MFIRLLDKPIQIFLFVAYRICLVFWFLFRPVTFGVNVAIWYNHQILLIKTSYKKEYTLPGGYIKRGENKEIAALREIKEELNIHIDPIRLKYMGEYKSNREYKNDTTFLFEITLDDPPRLEKDNREVVWAGFITPEDAFALDLSQYARSYLKKASAVSDKKINR